MLPCSSVAPSRSLHSPGPEKVQVAFPAAPLMEDFATFPGEGAVWMVVPTPLLVWKLGNREAPSLAPSLHSRQSPAVGQRKFGEGRKEEKIPDRFHLSKPRMIPLEACKPFSSQIHLFIYFNCWLLLKATRAVCPSHSVELLPVPHPGPDYSGKVFGFPAMKASLSGRAWMSPLGQEPVPAAGAGGGGSARRRWEDWDSVRGRGLLKGLSVC